MTLNAMKNDFVCNDIFHFWFAFINMDTHMLQTHVTHVRADLEHIWVFTHSVQ